MRLARVFIAPLIAVLAMGTVMLSTPGGGAAAQSVYYVAPNGSDSAAGTQAAPWRSFAQAQRVAQAGDTVYFRGGTYAYTTATRNCSSQTDRVSAIVLNKSGASGSPITYAAHPGERPVFDFSGVRNDCRIKGFEVTASWVHLKGLEVKGVRQNNDRNAESWGVWVSGSRNTFEQLDIHHNMGTGLFINGGGGNLVLNTDSHENFDQRSTDGPGENADGFGAHYTPAGSPQNVFRGARAWWNGDDGFDLISTYSPVTIEQSWAWRNGYVPGTTTSAGNGAGFKIGGFGADWEDGAPKHTVRGSVAFLNKSQGFYANHHPVASEFFNNTAYSNGVNFSMRGIDSGGNAVGRGTLRNNIAYTGTATAYMNGTNSAYNSWELNVQVSAADFQSLSTTGWDAPRQADGSLPELPHLRLAENSDLIDAGTSVGLPYEGAAPDLGAFESGGGDSGGTVRYEAEGSSAACDGTIASNHAGYSGTGFCDTPNTVGAAVQFTVNAASAGEATVAIRFANGSTGSRGADLAVNGATVASAAFQSTGAWSTWSTETVTVPLRAGANTIRLAATTATGLPNIDFLEA